MAQAAREGRVQEGARRPPRVRLARTVRPQKAPASSLASSASEDEDEYNANYCGSAASDAHELDKWAQAIRRAHASLATFSFGAGAVESFGVLSVSVEEAAAAARRAEVAAAIDADEAAAAGRCAAVAATIAAEDRRAARLRGVVAQQLLEHDLDEPRAMSDGGVCSLFVRAYAISAAACIGCPLGGAEMTGHQIARVESVASKPSFWATRILSLTIAWNSRRSSLEGTWRATLIAANPQPLH